MKILLSSYVFAPTVGGIQTVSALLAEHFAKAGHEVIVVTNTRLDDEVPRPYAVYRNPGALKLLELTRWCDVYFQSNISLRFAWPLLFVRRPWIIAHQTWMRRTDVWLDWQGVLKNFFSRFSINTAVSRPMADALPIPTTIIGNPYSNAEFRHYPEVTRNQELVFLGRLVSEKGVDLLLHALAELRTRGLTPRLSVIGYGPELSTLQQLAENLHFKEQVNFLGNKSGAELGKLLNAHQIMVIPSRVEEPFGVVALEGLACGCFLVVANTGGLPEAAGPCGITFDRNDSLSLADALERALTNPELRQNLFLNAEQHLRQFEPATIASQYLKLFDGVLAKDRKRLLIYSTLPIIGGNSTITLTVARQFRDQGWNVSVLTRYQDVHHLSEENIQLLRDMGCEVRKLTGTNGQLGWATLSAMLWVRRHGSGSIFITLCKGMASPIISRLGRFRKSIFYLITHEDRNNLAALARSKDSFTDFAVISPVTMNPLQELVGLKKTIRWLPQFSEFSPPGTPSSLDEKRPLTFGFLGTLNSGKGIHLLIDIWPTLNGIANLRIAGGGPLQGEVEEAAQHRDAPRRIIYDGSFSAANRDDFLRRFFRHIDVLIVPSVNTMEGIPNVILEALSQGIPVLASNLGGTACFGLDWLRPRQSGVIRLFAVDRLKETIEEAIARGVPNSEERQACVDYFHEWFSDRTIFQRWIGAVEPELSSAETPGHN